MSPNEFQQVLEWACKLGRFQAGHDLYGPMLATPAPKDSEHEPKLELNGGGMEELKKNAFLIAHERNKGNMSAVARDLKMTRSRMYVMAKKYL